MHFFRAILIGLLALIATGCGKGGVQSPDFTPVLQTIAVTPAAPTVAAGLTQQFTASGIYSTPPGSDAASEARPLENVEWSSSDTSRATIDATGLATAISAGPVTITASLDGVEATALLTVGPAQLQSLTITPATSTVAVDGSGLLTANGVFSDGSTQPVSATWTSGTPTIVSVAAGPSTTTNATGVAVGTATITATAEGGLTATAAVTVRARVVTLTIVPDTGTSPVGRPFQYSATGTIKTGPTTNSSGNTTDGSLSGVVWTIANTVGDTNPAQVASIDAAAGIAVGQRVGNAVVTAAVDGATDTAAFVVTPAELDRVVISPDGPVTLNVGQTRDLTANGVYTDGRIEPVVALWTLPASTPAGVVDFTPNPAAVTSVRGLVQGTGTLRASVVVNQGQPNQATFTDEAAVTVNAAVLQSIARIEPPSAAVNPGRSVEFQVIGNFSGGTTGTVDDSLVTWDSSNDAIATIDAQGFATGVSVGQVTITATVQGIANPATATLVVTESQCTTPLLSAEGAQVAPVTGGLCVGCSLQNGARIIDEFPATFGTLIAPVQLSNDSIIGARVTAGNNGTYTLPFASGNNAGFVIGRPVGLLSAQVLDRLQVSTLRNGVVQETKVGRAELSLDLLGRQLDLLGNSSDVGLVSIQTSVPYDAIQITIPGGVAQVLDDLRVFQACGTTTPPVQPGLVGLSRIEPIAPTIVAGQQQNLIAYGALSNGTEAEIADADLTWTTSNPSVATVNQLGLVTAVSGGAATITATLKPTVTSSGNQRTAVSNVTVVNSACQVSFSSLPGATAVGSTEGLLCTLLGGANCAVQNPSNAADGLQATFADVYLRLNLLQPLLGGSASLSVQLPVGADALPANEFTGFVLSRPTNPVAQAELLDSIQISTLNRNALGVPTVVETRTAVAQQTPLRLGLLGVDVLGESEIVLAGFRPTQPYTGIRVTFNSGALSLLSSFKVFESCATAVEPPAPAP